MKVVYGLLGVPPLFWASGEITKVELIALRSIRVRGTYFEAPALEFSTVLEVTEAETYTSMRVV